MSSVIKIVKRKEREEANASPAAGDSAPAQSGTSAMVRTVKGWVAATRDRLRAEADYAAGLRRAQEYRKEAHGQHLFTNEIAAAKLCRTILLAAGLIFLFAQGTVRAQGTAPASDESLTLDQAIALALRNNRAMKIAQLAVERTDEDISVAKTYRLPALHAFTLVSGNLARNELQVQNPAASFFPGVGSFITLNVERKPTAIFAVSAIEPLSQQYRIGLRIKMEKLSREMAQAKLIEQQNETIDQVKKVYYSILQTQSALDSVQEAVKSYEELDKVTGDYVVQMVALKADQLVVQTRLARVKYETLELSNRLATQKEQFNSLLGRDVGTVFEVTGITELVQFETDLTAARKIALERRPELKQARLAVELATLDRRVKKSEYIPDVSLGFTYLTPRNFDAAVPKNFANVGVAVSWEFFDWGRKKSQLAEKQLAIEQAQNGLKEAQDQVLIDVGDKLRKLQLSGQALCVAKMAKESARENLRVSTGQYRFQTVLLSDVLKSQAALAEASHEYQQALLAFWTAKAEFEKALGEDK
ncbi:MAG: TolC family protein [Acidobacteria bacterium]|nr:TolC family protein [Acidobacteriota bacterium]